MATDSYPPLGFLSAASSDEDQAWKILKRVNALKKLLLAQNDVEQNFDIELHLLECKYNKYYMDNYNKRSDIVQGNYEPTEEECDFPSEDENDDDKDVSVDKAGIVQLPATPEVNDDSDQIKGIPNFWLTIMKNITLISDSIKPYDERILSHLTDIKIRLSENPIGFTLEFCFSPNKWFTNTVLTKEYEIKFVGNENDAFGFKELSIYKCKGCTIQWKEGKDVTVKVVKKVKKCVVKKEDEHPFQIIEKTMYNCSFFNFFNPPSMSDYGSRRNKQKIARWLKLDYEIGYYIRERVIPKAVLYFTGEALIDAIEMDQEESECDSREEVGAEEEIGPENTLNAADEEAMNRPDYVGKCRHH